MQEILEKVQVHVPFALLREKLLPTVIRERIHPEIGFSNPIRKRICGGCWRTSAP
jgi:hypothetical protein